MEEDYQEKFKEIKYLNRKLEQAENEKKKYSSSLKLFQKEVADQAKVINQINETNTQLKTLYNNKEKEFFEFMKEYKAKEVKFNEEKKLSIQTTVSMQEQVDKQRTVIEALEGLKKSLNADNVRLRNEIRTLKQQNEETVKRLIENIDSIEFVNEQLKEIKINQSIELERLKAENLFLFTKVEETKKIVDFSEKLQLKDYFRGEIIDGLKQGICEEKGPRYHFIGKYNKGEKTGTCTLIQNDIEQQGTFENDKLNGEGVYKDLTNNKIIQGPFREGKFMGNTFNIGKVLYKGQIKDNAAEGNGYFQFTNGFFYEGKFVDDKPDSESSGVVLRPSTGDEWTAEVTNGYLSLESLGVFVIDFAIGELRLVNNK